MRMERPRVAMTLPPGTPLCESPSPWGGRDLSLLVRVHRGGYGCEVVTTRSAPLLLGWAPRRPTWH